MSLSGDYWLGHPTSDNVQDALDEAAGADRLRASEVGEDRYTVTNSDGDHPVCLTVRPGSRSSSSYEFEYGQPSVSVSPGPC